MTDQPCFVPRSPRWATVRAAWLREHPTCAACGGTDHLEVHHIQPVSWPGGAARELDPANLLTLCESPGRCCHLWLGHLGDWRSANRDAVADAVAFRQKVQTRPYPQPQELIMEPQHAIDHLKATLPPAHLAELEKAGFDWTAFLQDLPALLQIFARLFGKKLP